MKTKLIALSLAIFASLSLWAGNAITYKASAKLSETTSTWESGLHTNAFDVSVTSHTFADGQGTITFSGEVLRIGSYAFYGCSFTSITIPNSVIRIENSAFSSCLFLSSVTIPESISYIGDKVFEGCLNLTSITWNAKSCQDRWQNISEYSELPFYDVYAQITSFTFGETVDSIPSFLCWGMENISSVIIPENIKHISGSVFNYCIGLTSVEWNAINCSNDTGDGNGTIWLIFKNANAHITSFTIGEKVESIPGTLCYGLSELTSITIPNSVKTIRSHAFRDCAGLTSIDIPENVSTIYHSAFQGCTNITSITIPKNVHLIGGYTFADCVNLSSVEMPNEIDSIGQYAFSGCKNLTDFSLPKSTTFIGTGCFYNCSNLKGLLLPEGVTTVNDSAFYGCSSMTKLVCESHVENIGKQTIIGCTSLDSVVISAQAFDVDKTGESDMPQDISYIKLTGGKLTENTIHGISLNKEVLTVLNLRELLITTIPNDAFSHYTSLQSVYLPTTIKTIGAEAFVFCCELSSIDMPEGLLEINTDAFGGCWKLESVIIPNTVTSIGESAFVESGLTSITLGTGLKEIGDGAFAWTPLTGITIPKSVTYIGESVFEGCSDISTIVVENGNSKYNSHNNCNAIIEILSKTLIVGCKNTIIPNDVQRIGKRAFYGCTGLTDLNIPEGVMNIEAEAFTGCYNLTSIIIPNSVTSIKSEAFAACSELRSITIGSGIKNIKEEAFSYCDKVEEIHVRALIPPIVETDAFYGIRRTIPVFVPEEAVADYETAAVWEEFYIMGEETDLRNTSDKNMYNGVNKLIRDGQVLIICNEETYDVTGKSL